MKQADIAVLVVSASKGELEQGEDICFGRVLGFCVSGVGFRLKALGVGLGFEVCFAKRGVWGVAEFVRPVEGICRESSEASKKECGYFI